MSDQIIEAIKVALGTVIDPELRRPLPELGMVESVAFDSGVAKLTILLTISGCPMRDRLQQDVNTAVTSVSGVDSVELTFGVMNEEQRKKWK